MNGRTASGSLHTSSRFMTAPGLAQDVLDSVIENLKDDHRTLGTCALVSRNLLHRSRVHLFAEVTLEYQYRHPSAAAVPAPRAVTIDSDCPTGQVGVRAAQLFTLLDRDLRLADYVRAITVKGPAPRWTRCVASDLHLARFPHLRSLTLALFNFESFADLIPTVQAMPALEVLRCEGARLTPPPFSPVQPVDAYPSWNTSGSGSLELHPGRNTSLKTLSLSIASNLAAVLVEETYTDAEATARALYSARAFMRSDLLRSVTSLEIFDASTVLAWLPIFEGLGPHLHHVGIALHDVHAWDGEVFPDGINAFPSQRDTIVRVFDVLRKCTSLKSLIIRYDAEDTITLRTTLPVLLATDMMDASLDDGSLISPYFLHEAVRLFSGASGLNVLSGPPTPPFPALRTLDLRLVTTVNSLKDCAPACAALANVLASHEYPAFVRVRVVIEEPEMMREYYGEQEVDEAACSRKAAAVRAELFRRFEEVGIALDVAVLQHSKRH